MGENMGAKQFFFLGIQTRRLAPNARSVEYVFEEFLVEIDCVVYPPSNPSRQPAGLLRPLCGLSEACLFSSLTGLARKWASEGNVRHPRTPPANAGRPAAASLWPVRSLPRVMGENMGAKQFFFLGIQT